MPSSPWLGLCALVIAAPGVSAQTLSPCAGNDTVYNLTPADSLRGFHMASPAVTILPPRTFHGRAVMHILVGASGRPVRDSTWVAGVTGEDSAALARSGAAYRFYPARRGACAVASWTTIQVTRD